MKATVDLLPDPNLLKTLQDNGVSLDVLHNQTNQLESLIPGVIGALILVGLYALFSRGAGGA